MELDYTFFIQLSIYLFLIVVLKHLYFDPILGLLRRREALTEGRKEEAQSLRPQIEAIRLQVDSQLQRVREELEKERVSTIARSKEAAHQKIHQVKSKVEKNLLTHQSEIEKELKDIRTKLAEFSSQISKEIENAMLASKVVQH